MTPRPVAGVLRDLGKLARLTRDLPGFLRAPVTLETARALVAARLATREARFLASVDRTIYGNPRSPYRALLAHAGCALGDLQTLVARDGLERALDQLGRAGVYLTFDEFKGRREVIRGGLRFRCDEDAFDNPGLRPHLEAASGGTRGRPTSVKLSLAYFRDLAANTALAFEAHGLARSQHVVWLQGFVPGFVYAALGARVPAWFYPVASLPVKHRAVAWYLALLGRLAGRPLPRPRHLDLRNPARLARWLARRTGPDRPLCVTTYAGSAVRVAAAAAEAGLRLDHTAFITLGEPFTEAKRRVVAAAGARVLVRYAFTEAGIIGYGCGQPTASDDVHFLHDSYALVPVRRVVTEDGLAVDAFRFTSLLPSAPKILLNVESGDYGVLAASACRCPLGQAGLTQHLAEIRSFEKLTGEGMTFVRTDLLRVLDEVLPAHFGGTGADYQVIEEEAALGLFRLRLLVQPALGPLDRDRVRRVFLDALGRTADPFATTMWRQADTVEVERRAPVATAAGKILPFHLLRAARPGPP